MSTTNPGTDPPKTGSISDPDKASSAETVFGQVQLQPQARDNLNKKRSNPPGATGFTPDEKRSTKTDDSSSESDSEMDDNDIDGNASFKSANDPEDMQVTEEDNKANPASYAEASAKNTGAKYQFAIYKVGDNDKRVEFNLDEYNEVLHTLAIKQMEACQAEPKLITNILRTFYTRGRMALMSNCEATAKWIVNTANTITVNGMKVKAWSKDELDKDLIMTVVINSKIKEFVVTSDGTDIFQSSLSKFNPDLRGTIHVIGTKVFDDPVKPVRSGGVATPASFVGFWVRVRVDDDFKNYLEQKNGNLNFLINNISFRTPGQPAKRPAEAEPRSRPLKDLLIPKERYKSYTESGKSRYREKLHKWGIKTRELLYEEDAIERDLSLDTPCHRVPKKSKLEKAKTVKEVDKVANTLAGMSSRSPKPSTSRAPEEAKQSKPTASGSADPRPDNARSKDERNRVLSGEEFRKKQIEDAQKKNKQKNSGGSS